MVSEQIKKEIDSVVEKKLSKYLEIFNLPLTSQFKMLLWTGTANSTALTPAFNLQDIIGKIITIKSIKIVPYYSTAGGGIDVSFSDGTTETIPQNVRIDRLFDRYGANGTVMNFAINDTILPIMRDVATIGFPLDTYIDNVYYKFPNPVANITMSVLATVCDNLVTNSSVNPFVRVVVECYLT